MYCEPFCGAGSVFWRLPNRYGVEVLNDLDGLIVNLFRVLQDPDKYKEFEHRVIWTLYARDEFRKALEILNSPEGKSDMELALAFFVAANHGFSGKYTNIGDWGRTFKKLKGNSEIYNRWDKRKKLISTYHKRLQGVYIDNIDALKCIKYWDGERTLFYCDPPYVLDTRMGKKYYRNEFTDTQHKMLVELLIGCSSMVVLSGYRHPIYDVLDDAGWRRIEIETVAHSAGATRINGLKGNGNKIRKVSRTEVLWINPAAMNAAKGNNKLFYGDGELSLI